MLFASATRHFNRWYPLSYHSKFGVVGRCTNFQAFDLAACSLHLHSLGQIRPIGAPWVDQTTTLIQSTKTFTFTLEHSEKEQLKQIKQLPTQITAANAFIKTKSKREKAEDKQALASTSSNVVINDVRLKR
jgi:hypothetical protein